MIETSSLYKTLFNAGAMQEYQIEIEGVMYNQDVIYDKTEISENLFDTDTFTIGSFTVSSLKVKLWLENHEIPRNAEVKFYYRYVSDVEQSEWILKFAGNVVDRARYTDEITTIEAYSKAANYDVFLNHFGSAISSYPANARTVANLCATHLGLTIENIEDVYNGNIVEYPNELTMVQVLQNIAKSSGGNWAIVGEDNLRLVVLDNTTPTLEYHTQTISQSELLSPISMVRAYWKDDSAFEAGDNSGSVLEIDNPWATQTNTNYLLGILGGYEYVPVSGQGVYADPSLQLGDVFKYSTGVKQTVAKVTWTFDGTAIANIETPQDNEIAYDNPYDILAQQEFKRKVTLGDSYQGVSISREKGIESLLSPDGTEENATGQFYMDINRGLAFQYRDTPNDAWKNWLYFDKNENRFALSADAIDLSGYVTFTNLSNTTYTKTEVDDKIKDTTEWTIGENGYWYADGVKTDKKAVGEDGNNPDVWTIGANGNWYKNGDDTGQPSQGEKGEKGDRGATGERGPKGDTGTSVESVTEWYLATNLSSGVDINTSGWDTEMQTMTPTKKYLWNYEVINFSDGSSSPTIPVIIGVYGETGATGRSITGITEHYLATSQSTGVTRETSGWETAMQTTTPTNKYLWNYETITWSSGTTPTYTNPIIIGVHGEKGEKGADGISPIVGFLTNESITLPASDNGTVSTFTGATGTFEVYDGTTRKTGSGVAYSVSGTPSGITVSINATTGVYTVSAMTTDASVLSGTATLRAVYDGVTIDKILTVTKALAGTKGNKGDTGSAGQNATTYWINVSTNAIKKDTTGVITPSTITFSGFSKTGTANPVAYAGRFIIQTSPDGVSYTTRYTSGTNQSSYAYTVPTTVSFVKARLYLAGGTSVLLDEQTIPVLVDAEGLKKYTDDQITAIESTLKNYTDDEINTFSGGLGDMAFYDKVGVALLDSTIIDGGYIKTNLISFNNAVGTNVNLTGKITATSGKIGGWDISNTFIESSNGDARFFLASRADSSAHYAYASNSAGNRMFSISKDGELYARNASISGQITATSGNIGGFTIDNTTMRGTGSGSFVRISGAPGLYPILVGPSSSDFRFQVHTDGHMIANSAEISGKITATSGSIGGFTIGSRLTSGSGTSAITISGVDSTGFIWAGSSTFSSSPFRVTRAGGLVATNADISGKITATSGKIGQLEITSSWLQYRPNASNNVNRTYFSGNPNDTYVLASYDSSGTLTFGVARTGGLYATSATIGGTVNATGGYFTGGGTGQFSAGYHNNGSFSYGSFGGTLNSPSGTLGGSTYSNSTSGATTFNGAVYATQFMATAYNSLFRNTLPYATNTYNLGASGSRWNYIFLVNAPNLSSDIRLKENFKTIDNEFDNFIYSLPIGTYNLKSDKDKKPQIGINANFIDGLFPKEVTQYLVEQDELGFYSAKYTNLVPMLVKVVQSQHHRLIDLEYEVKKMKGEL